MQYSRRIKITYLNPPFLYRFSRSQRSPAVTKSGTLYFPMWLAYAAGFSEAGGHEIDLVDAPAAGLQESDVLERIVRFSPDILVMETSTPSIINDVDFCTKIKACLSDVFVVLVGTHVSALPEQSLRLGEAVDAAAIGEYDETIRELADAFSKGTDLSGVAGICVRDGDNFQRTATRAPIADLEKIPIVSKVYRRFLDIRNYFNPNAIHPMVTITTSRGCPNQCTFCVYPQTLTGHCLRKRATKGVVDEIEYIQSAFPEARSVFFEDDTFPANRERCSEICREMIRRG
ncbi:MAG: B12-binding domain-containing radical SAM protein, partial [Anaerolineae bacterium]